jgi:hypothetical protein
LQLFQDDYWDLVEDTAEGLKHWITNKIHPLMVVIDAVFM